MVEDSILREVLGKILGFKDLPSFNKKVPGFIHSSP
jgi:hypothetical protein